MKISIYIFFILLTGAAAITSVFGQNHIHANNIYVKNITVEDGLSQSNVNSILKDRDGLIWMATDDGLNKFDGYDFKIYNHDPKDSFSLPENKIWRVFEDSKSRLWVGTNQGGLCLFDKKTEKFITFTHDPNNPNSLCQQSVYFISEDKYGRLWVATQWGLSIFDYENNKFINLYYSPNGGGIVNNYTNCIVSDGKDHMYLGTKEGMSIINVNDLSIQNITYDPSVKGGLLTDNVQNIFIDSRGLVWVNQGGFGTSIYDKETNSFSYFLHDINNPASINSIIIRTIAEDRRGRLFFGTDGGGISTYDRETNVFSVLKSFNEPSFQKTAVYDIHIDNNQKMWIGTYGEGVKILDLENVGFDAINIFGPDMPKTGKKSVLSLAEDHDGNIWIGTDGSGLYRFNPVTGDYKAYLHDPKTHKGISSNVIKSICVDHNGNIYAGTFSGGLIFIDLSNDKITNYLNDPTDPYSIPINSVWYVMEDSDNRVWLGTLGKGLCEFDPVKKQFLFDPCKKNKTSTISNGFVSKIAEDSEGYLWVATEGGGINKYDKSNGTFERFINTDDVNSSITNNDVKDIYIDRNKRLWALTNGGGLNLYNPDKNIFERKYHDTKLPSSVVAMLEDHQGNYWITSNSGLYRINKKTEFVRSFTQSDGLQGNEFNITAKLIDSKGNYYFGGLNGYNVFRPEKMVEKGETPPMILTNLYLFHNLVQINDETGLLKNNISYTKKIVLKPSQNVISIEYAALSFDLPSSKNYAYKLERFDDDWNYVGKQRRATYTNLPPGEYVFKAMTTNNLGQWNGPGVELRIVVIAPWYERTLFKFLFILGLAVLIFAFVRLRTQILLKQKKRLESLVITRTKKIEKQKSQIEEKNKKLSLQNEKIRDSYKMISLQNNELREMNSEIIAHREQLSLKSIQLEKAHDEIKNANSELIKLNNNLEQLVNERTIELQKTIKKLTETDEGLNTFLYRSSHDLRGPITTLLGLVYLAKFESKDAAAQNYYDKIEAACHQMLRFLRKLRETNTVFRIQKENSILNWNLLFEEVKTELKELDPNGRCELVISSSIHSEINSDAAIIKRIIVHLIENAIVFNKNISPKILLSIVENHNSLILEIKDNGIGIPQEIQARVFEMFFRGSELSKGNGLGLFLVLKAVHALNGKLKIDSQLNLGTTFIITLPIKRSPNKNIRSKKAKSR